MKNIFLFDPSMASTNLGDYIIAEAVKRQLQDLLHDAYVVELPTHTPLSNMYWYGVFRDIQPDYKFVCGSNIVTGRLNEYVHLRQWNLSAFTIWQTYNSIFVGVGARQYQNCNWYTRHQYQRMFRKDYIHSVRDGYTEEFLRNIGIDNVINTGCPTIWGLTPAHCKTIPQTRSDQVVFTLTDYMPDRKRDEYLIQTLKAHYERIYFWPQGNRDYQYLMSLSNHDGITIIPANIASYDAVLENEQIDYVGTRLHGGIRALQKGRRSLILGIDNRAIELRKDSNLPVLDQAQLEELPYRINTAANTNIVLQTENIKRFLAQFGILYRMEG